MDCTYKGVGGQEGVGGGGRWAARGGGRWAARGGLQLPTGLFGGSVSPRSASYRPRQTWMG